MYGIWKAPAPLTNLVSLTFLLMLMTSEISSHLLSFEFAVLVKIASFPPVSNILDQLTKSVQQRVRWTLKREFEVLAIMALHESIKGKLFTCYSSSMTSVLTMTV